MPDLSKRVDMAAPAADPSAPAVDAPPATPMGAGKRRFSRKTRLKHLVKRIRRGLEAAAPLVLPIFPNRRIAGEVRAGDRVVRYYKHWPNDEQLLAEWEQLAVRTPGSSVFQSPYWQQGAAIVPDALGTYRLITLHHDGRLVGVAPMERRWGGAWRTADYISTSYHDPLVHPDGGLETFGALFNAIPLIDPRAKSLTLHLLSPESPWTDHLPRLAADAGYRGCEKNDEPSNALIDLTSSWDGYLASLSKNHRSKLKRRLKKVEDSGRARFVINDTEASVAATLPLALHLMQQAEGGKGRKTKWLFGPLMTKAGPALARHGRLVVYQLFIDDKLAASDIVMPEPDRLVLWNGAYDDAFGDWNVGTAIVAMILRHAAEQGKRYADLLHGAAPYKRELGAVERAMYLLKFTR